MSGLLGGGLRLGATPGAALGPLCLSLLVAVVQASAGRSVSSLSGPLSGAMSARLFGPRMDYDEWRPLGHGDPLKNDPTYDYVPPVLDRVHYWMEPKESNARRDEAFANFVDNSVPVPATMLVPPPPPPPATTTPAVALTPAPPAPPAPPAAAAYSSLNPFHHFEDRPVVPNVLFEEKPLPALQPFPAAPVVEKQPLTVVGPLPVVKQPAKQDDKPNSIRMEHKPASSKVSFPGQQSKTHGHGKPNRLEEEEAPVSRPGPAPAPASTTAPPPTSTSLPSPPTPTRPVPSPVLSLGPPGPPTPPPARPTQAGPSPSDTISSLVRGLLHPEAATTMTTLTTDPLFAHYKQPVTAVNVNGPAYLIIQGHSKVKTYGPVLRRYDGPQGSPSPARPTTAAPTVRGRPGRRHIERAP